MITIIGLPFLKFAKSKKLIQNYASQRIPEKHRPIKQQNPRILLTSRLWFALCYGSFKLPA